MCDPEFYAFRMRANLFLIAAAHADPFEVEKRNYNLSRVLLYRRPFSSTSCKYPSLNTYSLEEVIEMIPYINLDNSGSSNIITNNCSDIRYNSTIQPRFWYKLNQLVKFMKVDSEISSQKPVDFKKLVKRACFLINSLFACMKIYHSYKFIDLISSLLDLIENGKHMYQQYTIPTESIDEFNVMNPFVFETQIALYAFLLQLKQNSCDTIKWFIGKFGESRHSKVYCRFASCALGYLITNDELDPAKSFICFLMANNYMDGIQLDGRNIDSAIGDVFIYALGSSKYEFCDFMFNTLMGRRFPEEISRYPFEDEGFDWLLENGYTFTFPSSMLHPDYSAYLSWVARNLDQLQYLKSELNFSLLDRPYTLKSIEFLLSCISRKDIVTPTDEIRNAVCRFINGNLATFYLFKDAGFDFWSPTADEFYNIFGTNSEIIEHVVPSLRCNEEKDYIGLLNECDIDTAVKLVNFLFAHKYISSATFNAKYHFLHEDRVCYPIDYIHYIYVAYGRSDKNELLKRLVSLPDDVQRTTEETDDVYCYLKDLTMECLKDCPWG